MYVLSLLFLIVPSLLLARPCGTRWIAGEAAHTPLPAGKIAAVQQETEIVVGSTLGIAVSGDSFLRSATCRFVGENAYIFVQDNLEVSSYRQQEMPSHCPPLFLITVMQIASAHHTIRP